MRKPVIQISAILLAMTTLFLSGCKGDTSTTNNDTEKTETSVSATEPVTTTPVSSTATTSVAEERQISDELLQMIEVYPVSEITAPDGETLSKYDAVNIIDNIIMFDCAYVRYANPLFDNTDISPELFNWETYEFNTNITISDNTGYFQLKQGDKLDNGLTVTKTETAFSIMNVADENGDVRQEAMVLSSSAEFAGEATIEGILYCFPGIPEYIDVQGDLKLYPNPTVDNKIFVPYNTVQMPVRVVDPNREYALIFDGCAYNLGNIDTISLNIKDWFETTDYVPCKVTISNIQLIYDDNRMGQMCKGEIKQVEKI